MYTHISPLKFFWSSVLVALGYLTGIFVAGMIGAVFGLPMLAEATHTSRLVLLVIGTILLGAFIGPFASRLSLSRGQGVLLSGSLILFTFGSVMLEGAYFAPDLVSTPIPMLVMQQLFAATGAALVIVSIFGTSRKIVSWRSSLQQRPWYSWMWRFLLSAISYLVFYFVVGGLNYQLVTKPYYETHAGGLTVPSINIVLGVESIRSILIVFSVFLFFDVDARYTNPINGQYGLVAVCHRWHHPSHFACRYLTNFPPRCQRCRNLLPKFSNRCGSCISAGS